MTPDDDAASRKAIKDATYRLLDALPGESLVMHAHSLRAHGASMDTLAQRYELATAIEGLAIAAERLARLTVQV